VVTGRRKERLDALVGELGGPERAHALCFDIRDEAATRAALASLPEAFAGVDALINNAGLALGAGPIQASQLEDWKTMIDTNVTGLVTISRLMIDGLIARKGLIVNLSSIAANWPYPGGNAYGGTKAFVQQFSLGLRSDLSGTGVRVTSIEPGLSESEFTLVRNGGDQQAYDRLYAGADPLQPEDIAETIYWVASLPAHVNINRVEIMPVSQSWAPFQIARR
jgi:serine 3-dehydrogenase